MGESGKQGSQLSFNRFLRVGFQGSRVTSNGGLILVRELDERLGLGTLIDEHLSDSRQGLNKKFPLADLLRQSTNSKWPFSPVDLALVYRHINEYRWGWPVALTPSAEPSTGT